MISDKVDKTMDLNEYTRFMKKGKFYRLTLEPWHRKRTLDQNAKWHALIGELARAQGMDPALVKEGLKLKAMNEFGYPAVTYDDETYPLPSRVASTVQMGILFDVLFLEAAEEELDYKIQAEFKAAWEEWQGEKYDRS